MKRGEEVANAVADMFVPQQRAKALDNDERETLEMLENFCALRGRRLPAELALKLELLRRGAP